MPFAATDRPNLAVGLLQAGLKQRGIPTDSKYFNLTFESLFDAERYQRLAVTHMTPMAGEWIFSQVLYGQRVSSWESYEREVLDHRMWGMDREDRAVVREALELAPRFLRLVFESNDWSRYDLVGFTSTFQQTLPSLCLARMIRERYPQVKIALGGANFEAGMGRPYIEGFDFVDFVSTGEADRSFPALCQALADLEAGSAERLEVPPGFLYRDPENGEIRGEPVSAGRFVDLNALPTPDFGEFFQVTRKAPTWLSLEASRGCWWGQKAHCTFCGLNGSGMTYRDKSWQRVVEEIAELTQRYGSYPLQFADNILSMGYFKDLLPFWAEQEDQRPKFFETKANLRRRHLTLLRDSGVTHIQPGIESLADSTLQVMRKGVSAAQNIAFLRWCAELEVNPYWNLIYGFPQEDPEDYDRNADLLRKLTHLPPPQGVGPIRLDRFSPNFDRWQEHGFTRVSPLPAYRHIFPFPEESLWELAYYFEYDHPRRAEVLRGGERLGRISDEWKRRAKAGTCGELRLLPHWRGGFVLRDTRYAYEPVTREVTDEETALLMACDGPVTRARALDSAATALGLSPKNEAATLEATLDALLDGAYIAAAGSRLITLALLPAQQRLSEQVTWKRPRPANRLERAA